MLKANSQSAHDDSKAKAIATIDKGHAGAGQCVGGWLYVQPGLWQ